MITAPNALLRIVSTAYGTAWILLWHHDTALTKLCMLQRLWYLRTPFKATAPCVSA